MTKAAFILSLLISSLSITNFNNRNVIVEDNDSISIVNLVAVGDNLIHNSVLKSGRINDSTYNFDRLFDILREDFQEGDALEYSAIAIAAKVSENT